MPKEKESIVVSDRSQITLPSALHKPPGLRGSSAPMFPKETVPRTTRRNEDFYSNRKSQSWWHLRMLFAESWKASRGEPFDREAFISINPKIPELSRLIAELSQATVTQTASGKLQIDKVGDGERSPNLADAAVICFAPSSRAIEAWIKLGAAPGSSRRS